MEIPRHRETGPFKGRGALPLLLPVFILIEMKHVVSSAERPPTEGLTSQELLPLVYEELRRLAMAQMARERSSQTLQATALVHDAWLELSGRGTRTWQNRAHFFGAAALSMRRILILKARRKARVKHGGGQEHVSLEQAEPEAASPDERLLLLNEALERLEKEDPEQAQVVTLKHFGGFSNTEVARMLDMSVRTVDRQWACAKAWLFRWMESSH